MDKSTIQNIFWDLVGVINEIFRTKKGMNVFLAYAKLLTLSFAKNFTILRVFPCKISDKDYSTCSHIFAYFFLHYE